MRKLILLLALAVGLAGCAKKTVTKDWAALGGSRADAVVKLAYSYNPASEIPQVSQSQAQELAERKCAVWGYSGAEPFGTVFEQCQRSLSDSFGSAQCVQASVSMEFQCTGELPPPLYDRQGRRKK